MIFKRILLEELNAGWLQIFWRFYRMERWRYFFRVSPKVDLGPLLADHFLKCISIRTKPLTELFSWTTKFLCDKIQLHFEIRRQNFNRMEKNRLTQKGCVRRQKWPVASLFNTKNIFIELEICLPCMCALFTHMPKL